VANSESETICKDRSANHHNAKFSHSVFVFVFLCVRVCLPLLSVYQSYFRYGDMMEENLKKFEILSEGDANMTGKAEIYLR
jgi:hypothetical protein